MKTIIETETIGSVNINIEDDCFNELQDLGIDVVEEIKSGIDKFMKENNEN